jgi:hypothetical protein
MTLLAIWNKEASIFIESILGPMFDGTIVFPKKKRHGVLYDASFPFFNNLSVGQPDYAMVDLLDTCVGSPQRALPAVPHSVHWLPKYAA